MKDILAKVPFLRLLVPLTIGILTQYFLHISDWNTLFLCLGIILISASYFVHPVKQYKFRWMFGVGLFLFLFSIGIGSTTISQNNSAFDFNTEKRTYVGTINSIPEVKEKSIVCEVVLANSKRITCYFQKGIRSHNLAVGNEIIFDAKIERIKHFANATNFDYPRYMYNKGISGTAFLYSDDWEASGKNRNTLQTTALEFRLQILNFYRSLNLSNEQYSILSALTLGYKDALSDDLQQSFRTTGTSHILAVSGMHTAIIFGAILAIFSFAGCNVRRNRIVQLLVIACLWAYAFITGLSPSVVRACIMLSIFCFAIVLRKRGYVYNNLCIAAFLMLIYNPFWLFDLGFQLSFSAVISICIFQHKLTSLIKVNNKYIGYIRDIFCLSISAQIGTIPICLYYFGTFPTYFFITNLLVVPLVTIIVYSTIILLVFRAITFIIPEYIWDCINNLLTNLLKLIIEGLINVLHLFEQIPFALIQNLQIPLMSAVLLILAIILFSAFVNNHKVRMLQSSLFSVLIALVSCIIPPKNTLSIYQNKDKPFLIWNIGHQNFSCDSIEDFKFIQLGDKNILSVSSDVWKNKQVQTPFSIDYLHIVKSDSISLYSLTQRFKVKKIILDNSLSNRKKKSLIKECNNINIPYYDVSEKGLFRIFF